jgi:hypothetical protein
MPQISVQANAYQCYKNKGFFLMIWDLKVEIWVFLLNERCSGLSQFKYNALLENKAVKANSTFLSRHPFRNRH